MESLQTADYIQQIFRTLTPKINNISHLILSKLSMKKIIGNIEESIC